MRRWGFVAALLFLILANAILFVRLAYNRTGEPEATVTLTGREVRFEAGRRGPEEKLIRPISINLEWNQHFTPWLDRAKLGTLGFDLHLPSYAVKKEHSYYWSLLPRKAYVVLEYNGQGYEAWRREMQEKVARLEEKDKEGKLDKSDKKSLERYKVLLSASSDQSRLFVIDAGTDSAALRRQYPDRHRFIITAAEVKVAYTEIWDEIGKKSTPPTLRGTISDLLASPIYISAQQRDQLEEIIRRLRPGPGEELHLPPKTYGNKEIDPGRRRLVRFTICYGQNYEPWVADIRLEEEAK
jgi:Domain of unknown function (DUF4824)